MKCSICGRDGDDQYFEKHHLEPAQKKKESKTIDVCHQCGDQIHLLFDNYTLRYKMNDLETIREDEKIKKYVAWVRKQPLSKHISTKKKKRKK